jgi:hypothetical protein
MRQLVKAIKQAGKTTFLEVVSLSDEEGLVGAKLAVDAGFDILMGTHRPCYVQLWTPRRYRSYRWGRSIHTDPSRKIFLQLVIGRKKERDRAEKKPLIAKT